MNVSHRKSAVHARASRFSLMGGPGGYSRRQSHHVFAAPFAIPMPAFASMLLPSEDMETN
jgi:hypothetical protein